MVVARYPCDANSCRAVSRTARRLRSDFSSRCITAGGQYKESVASPYATLRIPDFRRLLLSHGSLTVAREAQIVVVGWQVFALTRDPLTLGLIGLAEAVPFIAVALYAGHVADRAERRALAIGGTIGLVLSAVAL